MEILDSIKEWAENSIVDEIVVFALIIAFMENMAQSAIKSSNENGHSLQFFLGIVFYVLVGYVLHYAYHKFPFGKLNVIWSCITIIMAMIIGYLFYDEKLDQWKILSLISAIMAIYFSNL